MKLRLTIEERKRQILNIGLDLILEKGFKTTAMDIAEKIGVSETYIYSFYPNKKKIIEAIYKDHFGKKKEIISLGSAEPNYQQRLSEYFFNFCRGIEKSKTLELLYLFALEKSENKPDNSVIAEITPELTKPLEDYLKSGIEKGFFRDIDPLITADFIHNTFFHFIYQNFIFNKTDISDIELKSKINKYLDLFFMGIIKK